MIFTMSFHLTRNMNAPQSNLTRPQAGNSVGTKLCWENALARLATATAAVWMRQ
jgi:hypothetical protein